VRAGEPPKLVGVGEVCDRCGDVKLDRQALRSVAPIST
jgi:hypothetical protein